MGIVLRLCLTFLCRFFLHYAVDEGMRIVRDIDDNFFVFTRS
jgi:hypothetical protein